MITVRDDAGDSLNGSIDGTNRVFTTSHPMRLDRVVDVFVNGACRMASLDNGYELVDARTVRMREAPLPGDTLSVRYNCTPVLAGVAGGQPGAPTVEGSEGPGPPAITHRGCPCEFGHSSPPAG